MQTPLLVRAKYKTKTLPLSQRVDSTLPNGAGHYIEACKETGERPITESLLEKPLEKHATRRTCACRVVRRGVAAIIDPFSYGGEEFVLMEVARLQAESAWMNVFRFIGPSNSNGRTIV